MKYKLQVITILILLFSFSNVVAQNKAKQVMNSMLKEMKKYNGQTYCPGVSFIDTAGKKVTLDQYKGKNILVNLWFIGCMPCFYEIQFERELCQRFSNDTTWKLLNICVVPAGFERWTDFIQQYQMAGEHLMMDEKLIDSLGTDKVGKLLKSRQFPTYLLLNSNNQIAGFELPEPSSEIQLDYILYHLKTGRPVWDLYKELSDNMDHFDAKNSDSKFNQWIKDFYHQDPLEYLLEHSK